MVSKPTRQVRKGSLPFAPSLPSSQQLRRGSAQQASLHSVGDPLPEHSPSFPRREEVAVGGGPVSASSLIVFPSTGAGKAFKTKHKTGSQARALAEGAGKRLGLEAAPPTPHGGPGVAPERLQVWLQDWGRRARRGPGALWRGPRRSPHRVGLGDVSQASGMCPGAFTCGSGYERIGSATSDLQAQNCRWCASPSRNKQTRKTPPAVVLRAAKCETSGPGSQDFRCADLAI
ncbi:unnamed protein product [Rangifer tarandus platyrhynchus]|uniref:Uncharacterized protein n=2 Tax=Rangifer tarandus platyrhynchus TaxID=3082113 RepID=A0ACB0ECU1_RANTA|nr:unnamed protein product [Rangifer tarandus platyrhynchus]CAI9698016.1 unnamed protein product [Rangifer tarandus platyrhynchus]